MKSIKFYCIIYLIASMVFIVSCSQENDVFTTEDLKTHLHSEYGHFVQDASFTIIESQNIDKFDEISYLSASKENKGFTLVVSINPNEVDSDFFEMKEWSQAIQDVPYKIDALIVMPRADELSVRAPAPDWELVFKKLIWRCEFHFCIKKLVPNFLPIYSNCDPKDTYCN